MFVPHSKNLKSTSQAKCFTTWKTTPNIPVVDMSSLSFPLNPSSLAVQRVAKDLHAACSTFGFFYLIGHGMPERVQNDLVINSRKLFDLPKEEKMKIHLQKGGIAWRGYMPLDGEHTHGNPDQKEGLYLGPEELDDHPRVKAGTPIHGKNQFPDAALPELRPAALKYIDEVTQVGHKLMSVMSVSLGLDPQYFDTNLTRDPVVLVRLWNYPPSAEPKPQTLGIGEHTDYGLITILKQEAVGLQFNTPSDGWINVHPIPNAFVCNVGDLLDRITSGRFKSRQHRVLLTDVNATKKARLSFPCFFDPNWDTPMKELPLDHLPPLEDGEDAEARWKNTAYRTLTGAYSQYLAKKLSKVFPQLSNFEFDGARASSTRFNIKIPH